MIRKIVMLALCLLIVSGCTITGFTATEKEMTRDEAEIKAFNFLYENTNNKNVFDKELKLENYVFDSWKGEDKWHVIIYVGHTFIEVWIYDDGTNRAKILTKTDYWGSVPREVKSEIYKKTNTL